VRPCLVLVFLLSAGLQQEATPADGEETKIASVRVHGNPNIPDDQVLRIASVSPGDPFSDGVAEQIEQRLLRSGRFESVEVRVRHKTLDGAGDVALVIVVRERRSLPGRFMIAPLIKISDEYGLTYGAGVAAVDTFVEGDRFAFPLSWGGERRAAVEADLPIGAVARGSHLLLSIGRKRSENPHYEIADDRTELEAGLFSRFRFMGLRFRGGRTAVRFNSLDEGFLTFGADIVVDTRADPAIPGDSFYIGVGWEYLSFFDRTAANRYAIDLRGYKHLVGPFLLAARFYRRVADSALPPYEKPFLGGGETLRGTAPGRYAGDNIALGVVELRVPLTSPLAFYRTGLHVLYNAGAVYDHGGGLGDSEIHHGVGFGGFFFAAIIGVRADIAWDLEGDIRFHIGSGFSF